ncbi:MAG TPA: Ni/Fe hydrogenase subunit alpha [Kiritimatiellae bacterium]|nr:Ni/Fe hydrogenase subunit alpha [Kiritimatiellia bacterium]
MAPDLLGQKSVLPLVESHPDLVRAVMKAHSTGNRWMEIIGGRMTHPVRLKVGGFTKLPAEEELVCLRSLLEECLPCLEVMVDALHDLADRLPDFRRETEYVALVHPGEYTFYEGRIGSTETEETVPPEQFEKVANEYVSPQSTAKWARWHRESYMVGALARFNLNGEYLLPRAAAAARKLGLEAGNCNPYCNNIAQMVECVQVVEDGMRLIDTLLEEGLDQESRTVPVTPQEGEGAAAVEAPRGTLFHRYRFDGRGLCTGANMCIPTNQNHANIQKDFEKLVPEILDRDQEEIRLMLEMLVRAYDPCISCSTHYLVVSFV